MHHNLAYASTSQQIYACFYLDGSVEPRLQILRCFHFLTLDIYKVPSIAPQLLEANAGPQQIQHTGNRRSITAFRDLLGATTLLGISSFVIGDVSWLSSQLAIAEAS